MARWAVVGLSLLGITVLICSLLLEPWLLHGRSGPFPGTTIGGYRPNVAMPFGDWLEVQRQRFAAEPIVVSADGFALELAATQLGIELDIGEMLQVARRQTQHGSLLNRVYSAIAARRDVIDFAWLTRFDRERARSTLRAIAPLVERAPVDAELDLVHRRRVHARSGTRVDIDATLDYIASHRAIDLDFVPLKFREVLPRVRDEDALGIDVEHVLALFETDFRSRAGTRAVNIRVAARALNGSVIGPGATFSFNGVVGPRIEGRGYREAPVIVEDELEPGVGGGVCQVATTLHAAAVFGGLEILERRSHSRPSGYAPLGLDATVIDGAVDLKLRNPYPVPIVVLASFPERFRIRIELVGLEPRGRVEHNYTVVKRYPYYRRLATKAELAPGSQQKKQKGNWGYDVVSTVSLKLADGSIKRREYKSRYWPVPEVFWIGQNTEISSLPALPDGATGVQLDGKTVLGEIPPMIAERSEKAEPVAEAPEL